MPNPGDFDAAKAINFDQDRARERVRQQQAEKQREEAEKKRIQAQYRANILELLRHADKRLEEIRNLVVSEFVISERWWTSEGISDRRSEEAFKRTLRPNQRFMGSFALSFWSNKLRHTFATRHKRELARYHGSWLSLGCTSGEYDRRWGLVKLRQPHAGYAYVYIDNDWDPRNICDGFIDLNYFYKPVGRYPEITKYHTPENRNLFLQIYESLEDAAEEIINKDLPLQICNHLRKSSLMILGIDDVPGEYSVRGLTKDVRQALDFVATGQPPKPTWIEPTPYDY